LEAAEAVLGGGDGDPLSIDTPMVLDGLSSLLDKNLLRERATEQGEQRFSMLETIRELAAEELETAGEGDALRSRHAEWCRARASACWKALYRDEFDTTWFPRLDSEHDDFRAALRWLESQHDRERMLEIAVELSPFCFFRSHRAEQLDWIARAIALYGDEPIDPEWRAKMLHCIGLLHHGKAVALDALHESVAIFERLNDRFGVGASCISTAVTLNAVGRHDEAMPLARRAVECFTGLDEVWRGSSELEIGIAYLGLGETERAGPFIEAELATAQATGDWYGFGLAANAMTLFEIETRHLPQARHWLSEAFSAWNKLGMLEGYASSIACAAALAAASGDLANGAVLLGCARGLAERIDYDFHSLEARRLTEVESRTKASLKREFESHIARGQALSIREANALALSSEAGTAAAEPVAEATRRDGLTAREIEVLRLLAEGASDREIGDALYITRATAARHIANIFAKIDVNSRTAAAAYAFRHGLIGGE
jgi:DNA-binding CsgD family transcriptional regulator